MAAPGKSYAHRNPFGDARPSNFVRAPAPATGAADGARLGSSDGDTNSESGSDSTGSAFGVTFQSALDLMSAAESAPPLSNTSQLGSPPHAFASRAGGTSAMATGGTASSSAPSLLAIANTGVAAGSLPPRPQRKAKDTFDLQLPRGEAVSARRRVPTAPRPDRGLHANVDRDRTAYIDGDDVGDNANAAASGSNDSSTQRPYLHRQVSGDASATVELLNGDIPAEVAAVTAAAVDEQRRWNSSTETDSGWTTARLD